MLLNYDDYGPGPVVVLLHGFPLSRKMWSEQESSLGSMYRMIVPDLRGHGKSAAPDGVYPIEAMADDVVELLDALQIKEPVVLGGLSMGGYVALALMARHPERFRALMLIDTRASADTPEAAQGRETLAKAVEEAGNAGPAVESMLPKFFSVVTRQRHPDRVAAIRKIMEKTTVRTIAGSLRGMAARPDRTAELPQIKVPTLVLVGADDIVTPPSVARAMADAIPGAKYVEIPDAGHLAPLENPEATDAAILKFLDSLP